MREERESPTRTRKRNKPPTTRLHFYGKTFEITDDEDPDEVVERYVASGQHKLLEKIDPELVIALTERFVNHQKWLDVKERKAKRAKR